MRKLKRKRDDFWAVEERHRYLVGDWGVTMGQNPERGNKACRALVLKKWRHGGFQAEEWKE